MTAGRSGSDRKDGSQLAVCPRQRLPPWERLKAQLSATFLDMSLILLIARFGRRTDDGSGRHASRRAQTFPQGLCLLIHAMFKVFLNFRRPRQKCQRLDSSQRPSNVSDPRIGRFCCAIFSDRIMPTNSCRRWSIHKIGSSEDSWNNGGVEGVLRLES